MAGASEYLLADMKSNTNKGQRRSREGGMKGGKAGKEERKKIKIAC